MLGRNIGWDERQIKEREREREGEGEREREEDKDKAYELC